MGAKYERTGGRQLDNGPTYACRRLRTYVRGITGRNWVDSLVRITDLWSSEMLGKQHIRRTWRQFVYAKDGTSQCLQPLFWSLSNRRRRLPYVRPLNYRIGEVLGI